MGALQSAPSLTNNRSLARRTREKTGVQEVEVSGDVTPEKGKQRRKANEVAELKIASVTAKLWQRCGREVRGAMEASTGYSQLPHVLTSIMALTELSSSAQAVLRAVSRMTHGYKQREWAALTWDELQVLTGITNRNQLNCALTDLKGWGWIKVDKVGKETLYRIAPEAELVNFQCHLLKAHGLVTDGDPTGEAQSPLETKLVSNGDQAQSPMETKHSHQWRPNDPPETPLGTGENPRPIEKNKNFIEVVEEDDNDDKKNKGVKPGPSSVTSTTTPHQRKVKTPREGKNRQASTQDAASTQPTKKSLQVGEDERELTEIIGESNVNALRKKNEKAGVDFDNTLKKWVEDRGWKFISKSWEVARDPVSYPITGKPTAAVWVFEDYLNDSRALPSPLMQLRDKRKAERIAEQNKNDEKQLLFEGDLFEWKGDGQTYTARCDSTKWFAFANRLKEGKSYEDSFPLSECELVRPGENNENILYTGDRFIWNGDGQLYTVSDPPRRGWLSGVLPGMSATEARAFKIEDCQLVERVDLGPLSSLPPTPVTTESSALQPA